MFQPQTLNKVVFQHEEQLYQILVDDDDNMGIIHMLSNTEIDDAALLHQLFVEVAKKTEGKM